MVPSSERRRAEAASLLRVRPSTGIASLLPCSIGQNKGERPGQIQGEGRQTTPLEARIGLCVEGWEDLQAAIFGGDLPQWFNQPGIYLYSETSTFHGLPFTETFLLSHLRKILSLRETVTSKNPFVTREQGTS